MRHTLTALALPLRAASAYPAPPLTDMVPEQPVSPSAELRVDAMARSQKTGANVQMLLSTLGERPLGIQASQLLAVARLAQTMAEGQDVRVETHGIRSQIVALALCCLDLSKKFDIERLTALAEPTPIRREGGRP